MEIQRAVCRHFKVDLTEVLSCRRYMGIVMPRQIAMALCKKLTSKSFPDIGRRFGGKDHTTVLHSWRKLQPAVLAAIEKVGTSATLNELVGMTAYYAGTMTMEIPYKKNRQQPSLAKINL
jgi:chromosomal replication initiation ATPase DnaA